MPRILYALLTFSVIWSEKDNLQLLPDPLRYYIFLNQWSYYQQLQNIYTWLLYDKNITLHFFIYGLPV